MSQASPPAPTTRRGQRSATASKTDLTSQTTRTTVISQPKRTTRPQPRSTALPTSAAPAAPASGRDLWVVEIDGIEALEWYFGVEKAADTATAAADDIVLPMLTDHGKIALAKRLPAGAHKIGRRRR